MQPLLPLLVTQFFVALLSDAIVLVVMQWSRGTGKGGSKPKLSQRKRLPSNPTKQARYIQTMQEVSLPTAQSHKFERRESDHNILSQSLLSSPISCVTAA